MDHSSGERGDEQGVPRSDRARRVAGVLRRQILLGAYPSGVLPSEDALGREYAASRNAVRDALRLLSDEGLVERRRGRGTLVRGMPYRHPLHELAGLAEALQQHGAVVNKVRAVQRLRPPPEVARRLRLPDGGTAVYLERLRLLGGEPVSLDCTYLAPPIGETLAALPRATLERADVFHLIETECGLALGDATVTVQAATADPATADVLGMSGGGALLLVERLTHLVDGAPVDLEHLHLRGDRLLLHGELRRDAQRRWQPGN